MSEYEKELFGDILMCLKRISDFLSYEGRTATRKYIERFETHIKMIQDKKEKGVINNENKIKWNNIENYINMPVKLKVINENLILKGGYRILSGYKNILNSKYVLFTDASNWIEFELIELYDTGIIKNEENKK